MTSTTVVVDAGPWEEYVTVARHKFQLKASGAQTVITGVSRSFAFAVSKT